MIIFDSSASLIRDPFEGIFFFGDRMTASVQQSSRSSESSGVSWCVYFVHIQLLAIDVGTKKKSLGAPHGKSANRKEIISSRTANSANTTMPIAHSLVNIFTWCCCCSCVKSSCQVLLFLQCCRRVEDWSISVIHAT